MSEWEEKIKTGNSLTKFRMLGFMEATKIPQFVAMLDINLMLQTVDHIKVFESGVILTVFLDGTEIEWVNKELG